MDTPTSLCLTAFDEAMLELAAPTYIVRVAPEQYAFAVSLFASLWHVSVVEDAFLAPTNWQIERYDAGERTNVVFNVGM